MSRGADFVGVSVYERVDCIGLLIMCIGASRLNRLRQGRKIHSLGGWLEAIHTKKG